MVKSNVRMEMLYNLMDAIIVNINVVNIVLIAGNQNVNHVKKVEY